jgi:hypothetical protein
MLKDMLDPEELDLKYARSFKNYNFTDRRKEMISMRNSLELYYKDAPAILHESFAINDGKLYEKGIEALSDKFARAIVWKDTFIVGAIGSRVIAGQDNCAYDSYENQLQRSMKPIVDKIGIGFEVRNAAQGGKCEKSYKTKIWCIENLLGADIDTIHYSWSGMERGDYQQYREMFIRSSLMMNKSPVPIILDTGDGSTYNPEDFELLLSYGKLGYNILYMQKGLKRSSSLYVAAASGTIGDGYHNTTRYGETATTLKTRRDSLGVEFRNSGPGPLLLQTVSDILVLQYITALELALINIKNESEPTKRWPRKGNPMSLYELGPPIKCKALWCEMQSRPKCSIFEAPPFGLNDIPVILSRYQKNGNLYKDSLPYFKKWKETPTIQMPKLERNQMKCQHHEFCAGYRTEGNEATNPITFQLPEMSIGFVAVCGFMQDPVSSNPVKFHIVPGTRAWIDAREISPSLSIVFEQCIQIQSSFSKNSTDYRHNGQLMLSLQLPPSSKTFTITHAIAM